MSDVNKRLQVAGASTVCAVLDMLGVSGTIVGLPAVQPGRSFAGPAFTVKASTGPLGTYDPSAFDIAMYADQAGPGQVIAIDAGGAAVSLAGGIAAQASARRGVAAWVVDGGMRDVDELGDTGIPIHVRYGLPVTGRTRVRIDQINGPIVIAGVAVEPMDVLVGDATGIGRVPFSQLDDVVKMADWITGRDRIASRLVSEGVSFSGAFKEATAEYTALHGPLGS
ncbi:RraA family protein [Advenella mimigardefordensis]|uniref:Putative 4-hydroxy-4-methyl-2-oxoglutarate aldolase n=1 Tax=Advenella mimigardefordensis (strain DSM 17166 / LMG 22922 / DPN7) TaxID=1247726 RepID=W0P9R0_ADVMD|nr:hypothetical protein [Advenella mimigardefordensis]AHG62155.1 putative dimethylmenaquinone methyltransferase [Advenella mimigardefordensis DPN7]